MDDTKLIEKYRSTKDQKWIAELFGRYVAMIYGVCLRYVPDAREAEDMTMEIYEKIVNKALQSSIQQPRSWLYVVAKHHCLAQLRKVSNRRVKDIDPDFVQFATTIHPFEEEIKEKEESDKIDQLQSCIKQLNKLQRQSVRMFYFENKTYAQIADQLEEELGQIRSHLQNGRRMIRQCMKKHGWS